jgi:PAS domain S-box-containing protein
MSDLPTPFTPAPPPATHAAAPTPADLVTPAWKILQRSQAATAVTDLDGHLVYVNPAWLALWGCEAAADVLGRSFFDAGFWLDDAAARALQQTVRAQAHAQADLRARHRDGSAVALRGAAHLVVDADGAPIGAMATFLDRRPELAALAQLDAQRQRLAHSEWRLRWAQQVARFGSWHLDLVSGQLDWSDEVYALFELDPARFAPSYETFLACVHPQDRQAVDEAYTNSLRTRSPYRVEHRLQMPDGRIKWVVEQGETSYGDDGRPLHSIGTVQDISAIRRQQDELTELNASLEQHIAQRTRALALAKEDAERASAAKTEFLSRMSHELRTPLNAILGFGQLLELAPLAAEDAGHVQEVLAAGRHLLELIDEMLDLAAIEAGHIRLQLQPVALAALVDECLRQITPTAQQAGLRLEARIDASCLPVHADRARLRQVLSNLLSNAVKYNRSGGHIVVESHCAAQVCELRVHDSGPGLSAEQIGRLFQPFERLDADRRGIAGTGIGLSVSKRLVELMGGSIGVSSQPGVGSVFQVRLPTAAAMPAALPTPPAAALASQDGVRAGVLYVDDHEANRRLMQQALQRRPGLRVRVAADAESALALACADPPALLLLDIQLPGLDGHALLAQLRAAGCSAPAVAVSAYAMPEDLARGRASGFVDYLTKPLDLARTLAVVDRLLAADGPGRGQLPPHCGASG